jgi:hypothetical protein
MSAFEQLKRMTAADSEPKLANEEISEILASYAAADAEGRPPASPEWQPTYRMNAAAREGWRRKAAKASELISTDLDGDRMSANQVFEHCQRMIQAYSRGSATVSMV